MESVAPPAGVMLSESTARLVDHAAVLGEPEPVTIKGSDEPVTAHRLLGVAAERERTGSTQPTLVGRDVELHAIAGMLDRSVSGHGCVIGVAGPAGIGKSRLVGETVALAKSRGVEVFSAFCESHTREIPFHVAARLLRDAAGITDLDDEAARARVRALLADDTALRDVEEALAVAEGSGDDFALGLIKYMHGVVLVYRDFPADRQRGVQLLSEVREMRANDRFMLSALPVLDF